MHRVLTDNKQTILLCSPIQTRTKTVFINTLLNVGHDTCYLKCLYKYT